MNVNFIFDYIVCEILRSSSTLNSDGKRNTLSKSTPHFYQRITCQLKMGHLSFAFKFLIETKNRRHRQQIIFYVSKPKIFQYVDIQKKP